MSKRVVALTVAGLTAAGVIAGIKYASRQTEVSSFDPQEIEEFGEGLGKLGEGLQKTGKSLSRTGEGLHESFEEIARDRKD